MQLFIIIFSTGEISRLISIEIADYEIQHNPLLTYLFGNTP